MSVIEKLDSVLALMLADKGLITIGDYLVTGDFLRDHGPAIRQAMIDAEKWRRWEPWLRKQNRVPFNLAKDLDARLASDSEGVPARRRNPMEWDSRATGEGEGHD